MNMVVKLRVL